MPNWMTVRLEADTTNQSKFDFEKDFTSFNDIVPMPSILSKIEAGSDSLYVERNYDKGLKWLIDNRPESRFVNGKPAKMSILAVARHYRAKRLIGYFDWYHWRNANWGTKWDMKVSHREPNVIVFDVPWSVPIPILEALAKKFPDVEFSGEFAEEQIGWCSGTFDFYEGNISLYEDDEFSNEAYERCFSLYGCEDEYKLTSKGYIHIDELTDD